MDEKKSRIANAKASSKTTCQGGASAKMNGQIIIVTKVKAQGSAITFRRLEPDDPIHNLVGRVAAEYAYFEHLLDLMIWKLSNVDDATCACLTAQMMGSWPRILTIKALCAHKKINKNINSKVNELSKNCHDVQTRRNRILHDPWWRSGGEDPYQFKAKPKEELLFGFTPISEKFLHETLDKITKSNEKAQNLLTDISSLPPT